jgi:hypothetical protein
VLGEPQKTDRPRETADLAAPTYHREVQGPDPFDGVAGWDLSKAWVRHIDGMLAKRAGEPHLAEPAARLARARGETVLVTGGVVRNALLGLARGTSDIDLVGTLRPPSFRDLAAEAMLEPFDGRAGGPDDPWRFRTTGPERFVHVFSSDEEHAIDYAPLRIDYRTHLLSDSPVWVYGTSLGPDARWRDASCNSLMYDPLTGRLYDPTENGLRDLGLRPSSLAGDPTAVNPRDVTVRPIDLPDSAPELHVARHVVRTLHLVLRFADTDADLRPVQQWASRHVAVIERALDHRDSAGDRLPLITKELRSSPQTAELIGMIWRHEHILATAFAADGLWHKIRAVLPTPAMLKPVGAQDQPPMVHGSALRTIEHVDGRWVAVDEVLGPSRPTRAAVAKYFRDELAGYESAVEDVEVDGKHLAGAAILRPAGDRKGPHYVELDDLLNPIVAQTGSLGPLPLDGG